MNTTTTTPQAPAAEKLAMSVAYFCAAHGITRPTFYSMVKAGTAPRFMKCGRRTLISHEAAADWRRQMEDNAQLSPSRR